jgi:hypothetical protein
MIGIKPIQQQFECAMTALLSKQQKQWWDDYRRGLILPEPDKTPLPAQEKPEKPQTPSNNFFIIAEWAWD